ncbi:hypothetical protein BDF19DRAFT_445899 [Syncephalis fuscata]|nr:hypothetical protein BDF19DRAFT_445899 [Syncephalis fuscata]
MSKQATSYMSDGHGSDDGSCASSIKESTSFDGVSATSSLKSLYGQIHHLVENEASFVRSLKHINDRIAEPVWKRYLPWNLSTQTDPALRARPSSQRQLISSLFYTTPALMRTHDNFLTDLKSLDMKALSIRQVVWIFYMNIPELQGHVELMDKHISALATFEMLRYTDATFLPTFQVIYLKETVFR